MISAIVYGRNDNYSYALDRRTALGLNQLALQLEQGRDEIIFVDYNSDNDVPTHPEALADTLTSKAVELIRVIRVRPDIHASLTTPGPPVREAVCRNVALRRVKQSSEWVLSTNPDCLLISRSCKTLGVLAQNLADGYYGLPRFELPRVIWEQLPRVDPVSAAKQVLSFADAFALAETVRHYLPEIGYDAPGDFQLAKTEVLGDICGFDEAMSWGWHVDSNINARLAMIYGQLTDFNEASGGDLSLFHTEHSRRISPKHASGRAEDSEQKFVKQIDQTVPEHQAKDWGFPGETFEEFPLAMPPAKRVIHDLVRSSERPEPVSYTYGPETFGALPNAPDEHIAAFLIDQFAFEAPGTKVACIGELESENDRILDWIRSAELPIALIDKGNPNEILAKADVVCLLAPTTSNEARAPAYEKAFCDLIDEEIKRISAGLPVRRVVSVNTPHSPFEAPFLDFFDCAMTPVASRVRFGEIKKDLLSPRVLTELFEAGPAGQWTSGGLTNIPGEEGYFAMVRQGLVPGSWRLDYTVGVGFAAQGKVVLDIAIDGDGMESARIGTLVPGRRSGSVHFSSGVDGVFGGKFECRIWVNGKANAVLREVTLSRCS
ncbi:hypothetical protein [uncultured Erythrobacter sp.]|uniref:hypothetical protein n=1 Tax=uncultured Erythrobacter sp. TaxID=263913 RepID=UPI002627A06D|nr:hypothetical protein [uncultured Erythrobacter sp.]